MYLFQLIQFDFYSNKDHMISLIDLSIISINAHGFGNNKICLNEQSYNYDITVVQETMCPSQRALMKHIENKQLQVFQVPGRRIGKKGRYSGGLAFLVNPKLNCEFEVINNNIALIIINALVVINVYMPYFKCEISDNTTEYELNVEIIYGLICKYKKENKEIIICGDFNTDFCKHKTYSKLLLKMTGAAELVQLTFLTNKILNLLILKNISHL